MALVENVSVYQNISDQCVRPVMVYYILQEQLFMECYLLVGFHPR